MKKVLAVFIAMLSILMLSSCGLYDSSANVETEDNRIGTIYNSGSAIIHVDMQTGVQYFSSSWGGTCIMVDEGGKPLIYNGTITGTNELTMLKVES